MLFAFCHFIDLPLMHNYPVCLTLQIQAPLNFLLNEDSLIILPQAISLLPFPISSALVTLNWNFGDCHLLM